MTLDFSAFPLHVASQRTSSVPPGSFGTGELSQPLRGAPRPPSAPFLLLKHNFTTFTLKAMATPLFSARLSWQRLPWKSSRCSEPSPAAPASESQKSWKRSANYCGPQGSGAALVSEIPSATHTLARCGVAVLLCLLLQLRLQEQNASGFVQLPA